MREALLILGERGYTIQQIPRWPTREIPIKADLPPIPRSRPEAKQNPALAKSRRGFFDLEQARLDPKAIRAWCSEYGAEWCRNRDGSYDAMLPVDGEGAWDRAETIASTIPGPATMRFKAWLPVIATEETKGPTRYVSQDGNDAYVYGPIVREYNHWRSLMSLWRFKDELDMGRAQIEVHWPSKKG